MYRFTLSLIAATFLAHVLADLSWAQPAAAPSLSTDNAQSRPSNQPPNRSSYRIASVPHMFGDFLGSDTLSLTVQLPQQDIMQRFLNGGALGTYTVTNPGTGLPGAGGVGTNIVINRGPAIIAQGSNGMDISGDNTADTFTLTEPVGSAPATSVPGTLTYVNGKAVYIKNPASGNNTPDNGTDGNNWVLFTTHRFAPAALKMDIPAGGGSLRRIKISENNSPEPRDRLLFDFNFFNDVQHGLGDVRRYTAGIEKTFDGGAQSIELRVPFLSAITSDLVLNGVNVDRTEFGNLTVIWKAVLLEGDGLLFTGGCGVGTPTGQDTRVRLPTGEEILRLENRGVHILPYFAVLSAPNEEWFWQAFVQVDVDANGNPVRGDVTGVNLAPLGKFTDQTALFVDLSFGYNWFSDPEADQLTAVTPMIELHYGTSTQDSDHITGTGFDLTNAAARFDILNLTIAANLKFQDRFSLRPGFVIPLRKDNDRVFDYEFMMQANLDF